MFQKSVLTKIVDTAQNVRYLQFGEPILTALGYSGDTDCASIWFDMDDEKDHVIVSNKQQSNSSICLPLAHAPNGPAKLLRQKLLKMHAPDLYSEELRKRTNRSHVRAAVIVIIQDVAGRYLLTKRQSEMRTFPNAWVNCGGSVDQGETFAECGAREVFEETGLTVDPKSLVPFLCWDSQYPDAASIEDPITIHSQHFCLFFRVILPSFEPNLKLQASEVSQAAWITSQDLQRILYTQDLPPSSRPEVTLPEVPPQSQPSPVSPNLFKELSGVYPNNLESGVGRAHRWALNECLKHDLLEDTSKLSKGDVSS